MYDFGSSIWIMLVLIIAFFQLNFFFSSSLNDEGVALLKFRERVVNDPFGALSRWNEDDRENKPCSWFGIECFDGYVVSLDLRDSCLEGTLAPELGHLLRIKSIILRNNSFSGAIPKEIRDLKELKLLDLGYNSFTRALPSDFEHNITILLLDNNGQNSDTSPEVEKHIMLSEAEMDDNHLICAMQSLPYTRHNGWGRNEVPLRMLAEKAREGAAETPPTESSSSPTMTSGKGRELQNIGALSSSSAQNALDHIPLLKPSPPPSPELLPFHVPLPRTLTKPPPLAPPPPPVPSSTSVPTAPPPPPPPPELLPFHGPLPRTSTKPPPLAPPPPPVPSSTSVPTAPPPRAKSVDSKPLVAALGAVAGFMVLAVIIGAIYLWRNNKITKIRGFNGHVRGTFATGALNLKKSELETACEDFSNVIGSSSIGTIYKGTLSSGIEIAVISLPVTSAKEWSRHLQMQFRKKIETLSKVNHKNFVKLLGYCEEENSFTRMMVFEYAPNGALFEHLHVREAEHLDWGMRLRVAMGIAYCLEHMHQLVPPITHPNFNSSAVSLAEDYAAKISDFSLWNQAAATQVQPTVTAVLSPSSATPDSNVYSFGLVLMEMMTGRVPVSSENNGLLEDWAYDYLRGDRPLQVWVDPMLRYFNPEQLEKIGEVIRKCLELDPQLRPTMKDVAAKLRETTGIDRDKAVPRLTPLWWEEVEVLSVA